jgi:hypothetical protein
MRKITSDREREGCCKGLGVEGWRETEREKERQGTRALLATLKGTVATIDDCEVLIVGPGRNGQNECLVVGTACRVMDARHPPRDWHCRRGSPSTLPRTRSTGRLFCYETPNILIKQRTNSNKRYISAVGIHSRWRTRMGRASSPWTSRRLRHARCGTFRDSPRRREASVQRSCGGMRSDPDTRGPRNNAGDPIVK